MEADLSPPIGQKRLIVIILTNVDVVVQFLQQAARDPVSSP